MRLTRSGATSAPPESAARTEERSRVSNPGSSVSAIRTVGTPASAAARSDSIRSSIRPGLEREHGDVRELVRDAAQRAEAATRGVEQRERVHVGLARREARTRPASAGALFVRPRWCSSAPFGKPVVPDVYWIWTGSSGPTSGSVSVGAPGRQKRLEVGEGDRLAEPRELAADGLERLRHRVAAKLGQQEDPGRRRTAPGRT